ncbi:exocyst complex component 3-like protein isoform X1 [Bufo gargarizans]|uniref:exocyst complex component 3-like protein isoform X1 n=1 Tax=Bufo gargarizans TaxID=30331 RepID=UPI001CF1EACB|nr:exocyst complex component 3-like protein isoform X1 [Bufo gargarizans]
MSSTVWFCPSDNCSTLLAPCSVCTMQCMPSVAFPMYSRVTYDSPVCMCHLCDAGVLCDADETLALEKADSLARGAALKWASGIFCRPDQLTHLGQYRRRETQRNNSIQSRLKSALQSYLEGVDHGLSQLQGALSEVRHVQQALGEVQEIWREGEGTLAKLESIRQLVMEHVQLSVVIQSLPYIYAVPKLIAQTQDLIKNQRLLEAHVNLRELEGLRDDVLYRLQKVGPLVNSTDDQPNTEAVDLVQQFFSGVQGLSEELAHTLSSLGRSALGVARSDPSLLVSAVRIIEREEILDVEEFRGSVQKPPWKPPGRPKHWRELFFHALEKGMCDRLIERELPLENLNAAYLANHLKELQDRVVEELHSVCSVLVPCVPPHYDLARAMALMCHHGIARHLRDLLSHDLPHPALYHVLNWMATVYPSENMMGHHNFSSEIDVSELGPLIPSEMLEEQLRRYTRSMRVCISQWIRKALDVEFSDWLRDQEPDKEQDGFYLSTFQHIVMQMLMENVQLAAALGESLENLVRNAMVFEMDNCLVWLREALVKYGIEHMKDRTYPTHYSQYLLAVINGCCALSSTISHLQPEGSGSPAFRKVAPCLQTSLEKTQKKACHLLLDDLQTELQPLFRDIPSRPWLTGSNNVHFICEKMEDYSQYLSKARAPACQYLLAQTERMVTIEYVRALMDSKFVCRSPDERQQVAHRMALDAEELRTVLHTMGLEESALCVPLIHSLQELFALMDSSLLSLEVSGLMTAFPDISDEHVLALLDLRGDSTRDLRHTVLSTMHRQALTLPDDYRPIFISIPVPARAPPFCLHPSSCA